MLALLTLAPPPPAYAWQRWSSSSTTTEEWKNVWQKEQGPGARRGHSMLLFGESKLILFGGRSHEVEREHTPKTYRVAEVDGTIDFLSYEDPLNNATSSVVVGLYFNDVWEYDLDCERYGDAECVQGGWKVLNPGAFRGGCKIVQGRELCTHPSERWMHGFALFDDSTALAYGGYSQRCEDYCGDLWSFDLRDNTWMEIAITSAPGKRSRFSMVGDGSRFYVFGGFRLWHGYADDNSEENRWESRQLLPEGGYLNDMWQYEKRLMAPDEPVPTRVDQDFGNWTRIYGINDAPEPRAGHVAALDRDGMWLFGGYTASFPYPSFGNNYLDDLWFFNFTSSTWTQYAGGGSRPAARTDLSMVLIEPGLLFFFGGFNGSHFFDDSWYFNATRFLEKRLGIYPLWPRNCSQDVDEDCFELEPTKPKRRICSSPDQEGCPGFDWYEPDPNNTAFFGRTFYGIVGMNDEVPESPATGMPIVPFAATGPRQTVRGPRWWLDNESDTSSTHLFYRRCTSVAGEPTRGRVVDGEYGRAASPVWIHQPRRRAPGWDGCRDSCSLFDNDELFNVVGDKVCTSDQESEMGLDYFRPNQRSNHAAVFASTLGGRHNNKPGEIYIFGGVGLSRHSFQGTDVTYPSEVLSDMWRLGVHDCANNCSSQGDCLYGFCFCHAGFYGADCSNVSCPGDFCYYDENNVQICQHCCQAGYNHTDDDEYETDLPKVPCSFGTRRRDGTFGESNGICDGFGTCQCAPPYVLDDCSVKDCPSNCSNRGYCSVEFPVSRCVCRHGYYGDRCQFQDCLNNCTWPNGHCNHTTGLCTCEMMYSPYNNSREYQSWQGDDCSFLVAYCAASRTAVAAKGILIVLFSTLAFSWYSWSS